MGADPVTTASRNGTSRLERSWPPWKGMRMRSHAWPSPRRRGPSSADPVTRRSRHGNLEEAATYGQSALIVVQFIPSAESGNSRRSEQAERILNAQPDDLARQNIFAMVFQGSLPTAAGLQE